MEENLKPTTEVLNIFRRVQLLFNKDMATFIDAFAEQINVEIDDGYSISSSKKVKIICENIILIRGVKTFTLTFSEMKDIEYTGNEVKYYIYINLYNDAEEINWYQDISPLYHLEITGRDNMRSLFPELYIAKKSEVDENKIYEYVHKYLDAVKVMLAEPDFQRLLYDPEFWIKESPYK